MSRRQLERVARPLRLDERHLRPGAVVRARGALLHDDVAAGFQLLAAARAPPVPPHAMPDASAGAFHAGIPLATWGTFLTCLVLTGCWMRDSAEAVRARAPSEGRAKR